MTPGRPIEYDRERSLQRAIEVFWQRGYEGASLSELCESTGLSKSTLYAVFGDKRGLFLSSVQAYSDQLLSTFSTAYAEAGSPLEFISDVLNGVAAEARPGGDLKGCLVLNSATELAQTDPDVARIVAQALDGMAEVFESALTRGMRAGELAELPARATALYLVSTVAGMKTMVKAGRTEQELRRVAKLVLKQLI